MGDPVTFVISCDHGVGHKTGDECIDADMAAARAEGYAAGYSEGLERGREVEDADATDVAVRAHGMGQEEGWKDGYAACQADVVAWLRFLGDVAGKPLRIERGEHVGAAKKVVKP